MSAGVAQANRFYEEVAETKVVWFGAFPNEILLEFDVSDNKESLPLWSSKSRIERVKKLNPDLPRIQLRSAPLAKLGSLA